MVDKINHTVYQGADFRRAMEFRDEAGAVINLTGYEYRGQVRDSYEGKVAFEINFTIRDQVEFTGWVDLHIPAASTASIKMTDPTEYIYDIEMVDNSSEVRRVMEGKIKVFPEVTK